jgi:hypothetical protein
MVAHHALLNDDELASAGGDGDRLHRSAAGRRAISGMFIDMVRPQAMGAVVGKAVADDVGPTLHAIEILASANEARRRISF